MSWVHIANGKMIGALNRLHSEVVALLSGESMTCTYEPSEYGDGHLWYTCSECGGHVSADYDAPKYCPHCGRRVEQGDSDEASE